MAEDSRDEEDAGASNREVDQVIIGLPRLSASPARQIEFQHGFDFGAIVIHYSTEQ